MKIKQFLYITDTVAFHKGHYGTCFTLIESDHMGDTWVNCGEITLDVNVDGQVILDNATAVLDEQIGKCSAALHVLEQKKAELLALPAPQDQEDWCKECNDLASLCNCRNTEYE